MEIAFIMSSTLPMPSVKGGAVENILQNYVDNNELTGEHNIVIYSKYDPEAEKEALKYKYTKFVYINNYKHSYFVRLLIGCVNHVLNHWVGNLYIRKISKEISNRQFDTVVVENVPYYLPLLRRSVDCSLFIHIHNSYDKKMKALVDKYSDGAMCVSEYIKESYKAFDIYRKSKVLLNSIDLDLFEFSKEKREIIREKYSIANEEQLFIYTGRLIEGKSILEMIQAFFLAIKEKPNIKLLIAGGIRSSQNEMSLYLQRCMQEAEKCNGKVIFSGYINYIDLPAYYSAADVGILPSKLHEAAPLSAIEMIASGLPLIANPIAGQKEMASYGNAVFLNDQKDFVNELAEKIVNFDFLERKKNVCDLSEFSKAHYNEKMNDIICKKIN